VKSPLKRKKGAVEPEPIGEKVDKLGAELARKRARTQE